MEECDSRWSQWEESDLSSSPREENDPQQKAINHRMDSLGEHNPWYFASRVWKFGHLATKTRTTKI